MSVERLEKLLARVQRNRRRAAPRDGAANVDRGQAGAGGPPAAADASSGPSGAAPRKSAPEESANGPSQSSPSAGARRAAQPTPLEMAVQSELGAAVAERSGSPSAGAAAHSAPPEASAPEMDQAVPTEEQGADTWAPPPGEAGSDEAPAVPAPPAAPSDGKGPGAEAEPAAAPDAPQRIAPAPSAEPSQPVARTTGTPREVRQPPPFGVLLERTLALRPR